MARPLRLDHAGAVLHVTSRGSERQEIFRDDEDRERFLTTVGRVVQTFRWVHAYVLMGNHYHLLVETPEPTLSRGMRHLNGVYTQGAQSSSRPRRAPAAGAIQGDPRRKGIASSGTGALCNDGWRGRRTGRMMIGLKMRST